MIKCNVTINGTISRNAQMRTDKDNNQFVSFPVSVVLPIKSGNRRAIEVSVSVPGTQNDCHKYQPQQRIEMQGSLNLRKRGNALYFNFTPDSVNLSPVETIDKIEGELEFRGTLGNKDIVVQTDKKGKPYILFSGFSTEKVGEGFEYMWVRFIRFTGECEAFLQPKAKVHVKGALEVSLYKDRIDIGCRVTDIAVWVREPYHQSGEAPSFVPQRPEDECPM